VSLRRRLTLACAAAVALAVVLAAGLTYWFVRDALRDQIDASLRDAKPFSVELAPESAQRLQRIVGARLETSSPLDGPVLFAQALAPGGRIEVPPGEEPVQLLDQGVLQEVAAGKREPFFADVERAGRHLRVYTAPTPGGGALQVARSLDEVDGTLARLRIGLAAVALLGVVAALALARLATRTAVKPVAELTDAAEHVARTRDLTRRIERAGDDELSRLAGAFNTMLEALDASQRAQRRLVADASHELRTPLTSLRTNLEVLGHGGLAADDHERLRADVIAQLEELTLLVSDLVDLAREEEPVSEREVLRFDELVAAAVERAARHAPAVRFDTELEPVLVEGVRSRLDRAVSNLLDNAAKYGGGAVEVTLRGGELVVRDHGPGIADEDLPFVFDRFYRAPAARGRPGSGLGLAIVRQAAEAHGGSVDAARAPGGGAVLRMALSASS
jgi:two-component system, OmpR family, sensor histidine kinase MprB